MTRTSGLNFINVLRTAFTRAEPKSIKKDSQAVSLLTLLGSVRTKAARKHAGEIEPRTKFQIYLLFELC